MKARKLAGFVQSFCPAEKFANYRGNGWGQVMTATLVVRVYRSMPDARNHSIHLLDDTRSKFLEERLLLYCESTLDGRMGIKGVCIVTISDCNKPPKDKTAWLYDTTQAEH